MRAWVKITKEGIQWTSELAKYNFLKKNAGQHAFITIDDKPTNELHRFYRGAVLPYVFYQLPASGWENFKECHLALKKEFIGTESFKTIKGETADIVRSTAEITKARMQKYIDDVLRWMSEQQMEVPWPDEYTAWRDGAPGVGEEYPQVKHLRELYEQKSTV